MGCHVRTDAFLATRAFYNSNSQDTSHPDTRRVCFDEGPCPQDVCDQPYVKTGIYSGVGVECTSDYFTQSGVSSQRSQHLPRASAKNMRPQLGGTSGS